MHLCICFFKRANRRLIDLLVYLTDIPEKNVNKLNGNTKTIKDPNLEGYLFFSNSA